MTRKSWNLEDDIRLLEESLICPKKWACIAKKLQGRNQHQIKNRFISLLAKDAFLKRKEFEDILKNKILLNQMTILALENLKIQKSQYAAMMDNFFGHNFEGPFEQMSKDFP